MHWLCFYLGLFLVLNYYLSSSKNTPVEISPSYLVAEMQNNNVESLSFGQNSLHINGKSKLPAEKKILFSADVISTVHLDEIRKLADEKKIPYDVKPMPNPMVGQMIQMIIWIGIITLVFLYIGKKNAQ